MVFHQGTCHTCINMIARTFHLVDTDYPTDWKNNPCHCYRNFLVDHALQRWNDVHRYIQNGNSLSRTRVPHHITRPLLREPASVARRGRPDAGAGFGGWKDGWRDAPCEIAYFVRGVRPKHRVRWFLLNPRAWIPFPPTGRHGWRTECPGTTSYCTAVGKLDQPPLPPAHPRARPDRAPEEGGAGARREADLRAGIRTGETRNTRSPSVLRLVALAV
eukprot:gene17799-biopygen17359